MFERALEVKRTFIDRVEIPLSRWKLFFCVVGSFVFVILFVCLLYVFWDKYELFVLIFAGTFFLFVILFFSVGGVYVAVKLFDSRPGLIIDSEGIYDNSHGTSVGFIKWSDIVELEFNLNFIMLYVRNPEEYIARFRGWKKIMLWLNNKIFGSPVSLVSVCLKCGTRELKELIERKYEEKGGVC